jgi:hypothetical protein
MITTRHHDHVVILNGHGFIEIAFVGVDALEREPCGGFSR